MDLRDRKESGAQDDVRDCKESGAHDDGRNREECGAHDDVRDCKESGAHGHEDVARCLLQAPRRAEKANRRMRGSI